MQTFAPEGTAIRLGFERLDTKRLGKQRVETYQLIRAMLGISGGWGHHPALLMWEMRLCALANYGVVNCDVWIERGYKDSLRPYFVMIRQIGLDHNHSPEPPRFLDDIRDSHRSNLIRKEPEHYRKFWPHIPDDLEYVWPIRKVTP